MQNTRLTTLVNQIFDRLTRWLRNPWRRISLTLICLLTGNFLAIQISAIAGQAAQLDTVAAALVLIFTEVINILTYRPVAQERSPLWEFLNALKIGVVYGLFLEAFKLAS